MNVVWRFIFRSIRESKFRTFLVIFSITVATALFFASTAIGDTMEVMFSTRMRVSIGSADIVIHAGTKSPSPLFSPAGAAMVGDRTEYEAGVIRSTGYYRPNHKETVRFNLMGIEYTDLQQMNPVALAQELNGQTFTGRQIIISELAANKCALSFGGEIELEINGVKRPFTVAGIAKLAGPFTNEGTTMLAIMPLETLQGVFNAKGRVSELYMKPKNPADEAKLIKDLAVLFPRYTVRETLTEEEIKQYLEGITLPFMMMSMVVLFMSFFIIYTSFRVIAAERLPVIGTFRSVGATQRDTAVILITESLWYGLLGGAAGAVLGVGVLYLMARMTGPTWGVGLKPAIQYSPQQMLGAFGLAVALSLGSAAWPILGAAKIPVKDIILAAENGKQKGWKYASIAGGAALIIAAFALPPLIPQSVAIVLDTACIFALVTGVVLVVPYLTAGFIRLCASLYERLFGSEGVLAVKNLRENRSMLNSIALLAIGISAMLMINTVSYSVVVEMADFFNRMSQFSIMLAVNHADDSTVRQVRNVAGVTDAYGIYEADEVEVEGKPNLGLLQGVDPAKFLQYWKIDLPGRNAEAFQNLNSGRNVMLTNALREKFSVREGDYLVLNMANGKKAYRVAGFFNSLMNAEDYAIIPEQYFRTDQRTSDYSTIYVKTSEAPETVAKRLRDEYVRRQPWVMTMKEIADRNFRSNIQLFNILKGFSLITLLSGIFGVMNNLTLGFIRRKRTLAIFRSVGMSKWQMIKMILLEALAGGMVGGCTGAGTGVVAISIVPYVLAAINRDIPMHYSWALVAEAALAGIAITLAASVSPALRSSHLSVIEAIKYE